MKIADFPAAYAAFSKARDLLTATGKTLRPDLLAGLAAASWLTGNKDAAIETYKALIESDRETEWAKAETISTKNWSEAEAIPLEAVRAATLAKYPELASRPSSN